MAKTTDIGELVSNVRKLTSNSTGPRTEAGKIRSALNATRHGLAGVHLLLPGEDLGEYERRMDGAFAALDPKDDAQAQVVALIGDDLWKLDRLGRIEQGLTLARIEELFAHTDRASAAGRMAEALKKLGGAITEWERTPLPTSRESEYRRRLNLMRAATDTAAELLPEFPLDWCAETQHWLSRLDDKLAFPELSFEVYNKVYQAACVYMAKLIERGEQETAASEVIRKAIATIAVPGEPELKKIARYRKTLEDGLQRRLASLDLLRKLCSGTTQTEDDKASAREYRLKLRVVA